MKRVLVIFGTRPEAIKLCGVIAELEKKEGVECFVCNTAQHTDMLWSVIDELSIKVDFELCVYKEGQSLSALGASLLFEISRVIERIRPDVTLVHGDTASAYFGALASFFNKVPIAHVEAGLRSGNAHSPFPEELFRRSVTDMSDIDLAPTELAAKRLLAEGKSRVYITGNTVIDTLASSINKDYRHSVLDAANGRRILLVTLHRRENIGEPMVNILSALREIDKSREDIFAVLPMHKNPLVREIISAELSACKSIYLCEPFGVRDFHNIMAKSFAVLTDSGGVQEEAAHLGVPVIVARENTERSEGILCGAAMLGGCTKEGIISSVKGLLDDSALYEKMKKAGSPYGDGKASLRVANAVCEYLGVI